MKVSIDIMMYESKLNMVSVMNLEIITVLLDTWTYVFVSFMLLNALM